MSEVNNGSFILETLFTFYSDFGWITIKFRYPLLTSLPFIPQFWPRRLIEIRLYSQLCKHNGITDYVTF